MFKFNNKRLATLALLMFFSQSVMSSIVGYSLMVTDNQQKVQVNQRQSSSSSHQLKSHFVLAAARTSHHHSMSKQVNNLDLPLQTNHMKNMKDCCTGGSNCTMVGCVFITLPSTLNLQGVLQTHEVNVSYYQSMPSSPISSLYRPPLVA